MHIFFFFFFFFGGGGNFGHILLAIKLLFDSCIGQVSGQNYHTL